MSNGYKKKKNPGKCAVRQFSNNLHSPTLPDAEISAVKKFILLPALTCKGTCDKCR